MSALSAPKMSTEGTGLIVAGVLVTGAIFAAILIIGARNAKKKEEQVASR